MKQHQAVEQAMREAGGYATLGHLNQAVLKIPGCAWGTKTPFASIRRIVQQRPEFFKIRPGLWALKSHEARIRSELSLEASAPKAQVEQFNHTYYQGLLVELGNLRSFETFVPRQDGNRKYLQRRLGQVATLERFPEFTYPHILRHGQTVDVSWFNERELPRAFFEVEHSTDIQNSLLKFMEFQDFRVQFIIVADEARKREYVDKLGRAAFKPIVHLVEFWNYDKLSRLHEKESELSLVR